MTALRTSGAAGKGKALSAWLLMAVLCLPVSAMAKDSVYDQSGFGDAYGNGAQDDGTGGVPSSGGDDNTLTVNASMTGNAYGGYASTSASGNTLTINSSGKVIDGYGGYSASSGDASNNTVKIDGGTVTGKLFGGYANSASGNANGNTIIITGGTLVNAQIAGGQANNGTAMNNTIIISGNPNMSGAQLQGANVAGGTASGNTLKIKTSGLAVGTIGGFQELHFYIPDSVAADDTLLTAVMANIAAATVKVGINGNNSSLQVGDSVTLIDATAGGLMASNLTNGGSEGMVGISKKLTFDLDTNTANMLKATILSIEGAGSGGQIAAQLKSLAESRMSGLGLVNQGMDMLGTQGISQLRANAAGASGPAAFGVMGGQSLRYNSGSHVDVDGFNLVTGLGWNFALDKGKNGNLLLGAFFEAGWGSYDSHNSFGNAASVKGNGNTNYYGGGILGRYDTAPVGPGNLYAEASLRAGRVETDYGSRDFMTASGSDVGFDSSAAYYGAHAGIGYIWNLTEQSSLDLYTKYLWTRQNGDTVTIEGDSIRFRTMDSHRWRTGARFSHALATDSGPVFTPYVGAAYEHEFDSKARATANGDAIDAPDVKGGTGIGELGFTFMPSADSGLTIDLAVQGYVGRREGGGGSVQLNWAF